MKIFLFICCLFVSFCLHAQDESDTTFWQNIEHIDDLVDNNAPRLDSDNVRSFTRINEQGQKELWRYDTINDSLFQFKITYEEKTKFKSIKRIAVDEYFFLLNHKLLYEKDGEIYDGTRWSEECFFKGEELVHYRSHGHGKSEEDDYSPDAEIPLLFEKRYKQLQYYLK